MKTFLPFLFILFGFNIGYNQTSLQYVFSNESHRFYDVSNFKNVQIGVGQFHPCTYAYICALSDNNQSKWEKSFDFLSYSFFSDILRVNDSTFYAVGEEWLADDIESIISILLVKMDINGNLLLFKKITDPQLLNNQNFYVNCKIQELPNKDLVISAGNKLAYLTADGVIYKYTFLTNKVKDFELITQDEFYYISESGLFHYDQINHEELVLTGYQGLNSLNLYNSGIYFMDQNGKLYRSDLNGQNITIFSDSIGLKHVVDFEFNKDKLYIIGDDLNGINQLFVLDEIAESAAASAHDVSVHR